MSRQTTAQYLETFFAEKDLPVVTWEIDDGAYDMHIINSEFVIDLVKATTGAEADKIADTIRRIDFANGDVLHFLHHLATGYIKTRVHG